ncbi:MAG: UvrD-helicase domain-containing protein [Candidatus Omnitrophica bacterium]|nr:UvrD-helicase domain-containing protein [Candidatus Omnitrophota bacterium]
MRLIADFHIHSHFSLATSQELTPEGLDYWAKLKGVTIIGTGDFTHPGWIEELKTKLTPAEPGLFKLARAPGLKNQPLPPKFADRATRFLLTAEISTIYKKNGKVRKIHNLLFAPDFKSVERLQKSLLKIGANITSDGRPIIGLDAKNLLAMALDASPEMLFIPAHIWTPWFSVLGSKSGFNSVEECFTDLSDQIYAVETGLSSDAPMNWLCPFLDRFTLIANSDAHSPDRLGRNANIFDIGLSYRELTAAVKSGDPRHCLGSIHLFPQEGKYHFDGHRKCGIGTSPLESLKLHNLCPACGKPLTIGVLNRVAALSGRADPLKRPRRLPFYSIIPLPEILAEIEHCGSGSKKVTQAYFQILNNLGPELPILLSTPLEEIRSKGYPLLATAIERLRQRRVYIEEGYDGEYGKITVFAKNEIPKLKQPNYLFETAFPEHPAAPAVRPLIPFDLKEYHAVVPGSFAAPDHPSNFIVPEDALPHLRGLNPEQRQAVQLDPGPALILAGPGTGKTKTLICRIIELVTNHGVNPRNILAITFTNKAAQEMRHRLQELSPTGLEVADFSVMTFHAFGQKIIKNNAAVYKRTERLGVVNEDQKRFLLKHCCGTPDSDLEKISSKISLIKQQTAATSQGVVKKYEKTLAEMDLVDFDDLQSGPLRLFAQFPDIRHRLREQYCHLLIDEYQDINPIQYELIRALMPDDQSSLFAIGDPNQAIYGFRGADIRFIRQFQKDYPQSRIISLRTSYRCSQAILQASTDVIATQNESPQMLESLSDGIKIRIAPQSTDQSEAEFIARAIEKQIGGTRFFSLDSGVADGHAHSDELGFADFAILCRVKALMPAIEKALNDHAIPYQKSGETPFFTQEPIATLIDSLRFFRHPQHPFILFKIQQAGLEKKLSALFKKLKTASPPLQEMFTDLIAQLLPDQIQANSANTLQQLLNLSLDFGNDPEGFLNYVDTAADSDNQVWGAQQVHLTTIHAAKGLEFACVFIAGCEDGLIPFHLYPNQTTDREEERRLLFVGMTRAKNQLILTRAQRRVINGRTFRLPESPFLLDIRRELFRLEAQNRRAKKSADHDQLKLFENR